MGTLYKIENTAAATGGPQAGVTTSTSLFTLLQVQTASTLPAGGSTMRVVEWGLSFNASALAAPFACDLLSTSAAQTGLTAFAAADIAIVNPTTPAQSGTTSGAPFILSTSATGFTASGSEVTATAANVYDSQFVEPIGGYYKQFPLGREPTIAPGTYLRVRVHGDGSTKCICYVVVEV
jgi:hypothetical protein